MLSTCKTCLSLSEEVDFAAPGSVRESLCDLNEFFHKTFGCCCKEKLSCFTMQSCLAMVSHAGG